jgi:exportin-T
MLDVVAYPHISIAPLYFENVVRYTPFFDAHFPEYIPNVLSAFAAGLRNDNIRVRNRVYYLFLRFVKVIRDRILPLRDTVLASVGVFPFFFLNG